MAQFIGSAVVTVATFGVAMVVMFAVNAMGMLRLPADRETYGLDLHEHGISAYPEYVISALGRPAACHRNSRLAGVTGIVGATKHAPGIAS